MSRQDIDVFCIFRDRVHPRLSLPRAQECENVGVARTTGHMTEPRLLLRHNTRKQTLDILARETLSTPLSPSVHAASRQ